MKSDVFNNENEQTELSDVKDYFNIVLIGDSSVGKTSILEKYINNSFKSNLDKTKLIDIYKKDIYFHSNSYKLKFWDITKFIGNSDISELNMFYNCDGIIFVSSYDSESSLENLNIWYQLLIEYVDLSMKEMIWLINKKDLTQGKLLTKDKIEKKSKDLLLDYYEVSAKSGENIEIGIENIVKKLIKRFTDDECLDLDNESTTSDSQENFDMKSHKKDSCNIF